ncbi:M1 family metallopeptidase [Flammeovirga aprica]|uniref:Aminopeptidase N n=1 Tax=Flammeovirga aprica JL-4 TaxID=694437 RepID=A0A7X9RWB3_9BACT|nr:M1 family aminopeptidase [Flammeovirga aprica]NME69860.1 peptidase M1 [Flammeovirga aprica JL-4]
MKKLYIIILGLFLMFNACQSPEDLPLKKGVSQQLAQQRFDNITNVEYDLHLVLPKTQKERIQSTLHLRFDVKNSSEPIVLDFRTDSTKITNLIVNNQPSEYYYKQEHIIIPTDHLEKGENSISFHFVAGDQSLNRKENYMYTLLVPDRARTLFPCFDQPDIKAKYILSLDMPENWDAIAGEYGTSKSTNTGRKVITFGQTQPISTYLFSFVAGEFKRIEKTVKGRKYAMLHLEEEDKIRANQDQIFELHANSVQWMEEYTAIPLPFNKLDFALIPPFQYGGMEHVGAIQYRASSLILDENAGPSEKLRRAQLIAHEVAHMWFGDLVTMKWFDDVWLKEVFANFIAAKAITPSYPEINHDLQFFLSHQYRAYEVDRTAGNHPIQQKLDNLNLAGTLYGAIIYCKAPVVMAQIELLVGEDNLKKSLQMYLKKYAYGNATFDDLIEVISSTSKVDLKDWANLWVKHEGMPYYKLEKKNNQLSISTNDFKKSQKVVIGNQEVLLDKKQVIVALKELDFPLDRSGKNYGHFQLSIGLINEIKANIGKYAPTEKAIAYSTLWENFLHDNVYLDGYTNFIWERMILEEDLLLKKQLLGQFNELYWYYISEQERKNISKQYFHFLQKQIAKSENKALQSFYFNVITLFQHQPEQLEYLNTFLSTQKTTPSLNDRERINLLMKLRLQNYHQSEVAIQKVEALISSDYYKEYLAFVTPATSNDEIERDAFFEGLKEVENRANEPWVENALSLLNHPLNAKSSLKYVRPTLELLPEIQKTGDIFFPYNYLKSAIAKRKEQQTILWVNSYLEKNKIDIKLKNKVLQNLDPIQRRQSVMQ